MIFGNLGKMGEVLRQAKQLKDELSKARYEGEAGGVKVIINGEMEIVELKIPQEANVSKLESLIKDAVNRAMRQAKVDMAAKMSKVTGGLQLPGL